ncbi:U5 small nuclear ribonucleoprotein TSSC4 [Conger conger]|uniref:U5 small nuclear ribonucleoprotein TSSC4 n=1 Tax=Conger conger TaxID=82655 RepID=UPI002A5AFE37|nr:U5 small nuclear ribonucleoprotein TSSC4 [Conger conger]XP_061091486.1 U5 small nuclear ribonucleoprotein TSSC4 [Conger conger]XP_061091487.1 U5 small nuclear ribonucleoprotein TSSC4 [Conger conger]XP_061091488.1 U5 small nuclear ribonucleoprotein TSSC4 [Conger conger]
MCDQENPSNVALKNPVSSDAAELSDTSSLSDSDPEDSATHFRAEVENLSSSGDSSPDRAPLGACGRSGPRKLPFQLQGGSADFSSRSQSIFACLESAAKLASPGLGEDNVIDGTFLRPMPLLPQRKREEKREGVAGRPPPTPPSSAAGVPESPTHSPRWTKYSLEDVPETSERKNSQVALEYIQGLQQRRRESQTGEEPFVPAFNQDHSSRGDSKILFSRPGRRDEGQAARDKAHEGCASEGGKKKEVGLFHLEEPEEDPKSAEPSKGPRKRNCAPEEEEEDDGQPQSAVGFNSGRKVNRKKFRRGGEQEEEEN